MFFNGGVLQQCQGLWCVGSEDYGVELFFVWFGIVIVYQYVLFVVGNVGEVVVQVYIVEGGGDVVYVFV